MLIKPQHAALTTLGLAVAMAAGANDFTVTALHPTNATNTSQVWDGAGQSQIGFATFPDGWRALIWNSEADSFVDLHPAAGSPESYIDLSSALDATWNNSAASSVWIDGTTLNIGGWATNLVSGNREALLWTMEIPGAGPCNPADLAEPFNQLNFFDVSEFLALFSAGDPAADFNNDTEFNFFDVSEFLAAFTAGCP